ncbi:hypothetical protein Tco_0978589 [Tanacetum coccineum]|uniref:Reverse transcriptase domain-containing protein n=1 Tax=Tanacetum coccineum TaxID=301880 RepID=A0ABQ5ENT8_9ASTR
MADRTMEELLRAPSVHYGGITMEELLNVPNDVIKLMMFPYSLEGPSNPTKHSPKKVVERETEEITDEEKNNFQGSTAQILPPVIPQPIPEPEIPKTVPKANIPYPSRRDNQKNREKASYQKEKIFQMFQDLRFDISFADALFLMPRFAPTIRDLLMNKEKLLEFINKSLIVGANLGIKNKASAKLISKVPYGHVKVIFRDIFKFQLILKIKRKRLLRARTVLFSLPELSPTRMTLELADRSITYPKGLAEDVYVKVGKFHFPADFVVVDFEADPRYSTDLFQLPPMDLKKSEVTETKSSIEEPPELELKDLPSHLEYAFLEENDKLHVIIAKGLKSDQKEALINVLKYHKRAIAWKITDIKGILMEDDCKPSVQSQRRVNPKIHEVIKKEVVIPKA